MQTKEIGSKTLALACITGFCFLLCATSARAQFSYTTNNGAVTITGYFGASGAVTVPDVINGYPVTALDNFAFGAKIFLNSVTIGSNLTTIGEEVFQECMALSSFAVSSQNAFFSSANGALYNKSGSILLAYPAASSLPPSIPAGVTTIGEDAFDSCKFSSITLPNNLTNIAVAAFENLRYVTSIAIPGKVSQIGDDAFVGCSSLTAISVNSTNLYFSSTNGVLFDKTGQALIAYPENKSDTSFNIPANVTTVASNAMSSCINLTNVSVSSNVTYIGGAAFASCANLKAITVDAQNNFYSSSNGVLFDKFFSTLITCPGGFAGSYVIPDTVTMVEIMAFVGCSSLSAVILPDGVTNIGYHTFQFCRSLTNVTLGGNLTGIDSGAFGFCQGLPGITLDRNLTTIGASAFFVCSSLTNIVIPDSVTNIGSDAFGQCSKLSSISIGKGLTTINDQVFFLCTNLTNIVIPDGVTNIGSEAFAECYKLSSVSIGKGLTTIGSGMFFNCSGLTNIIIPGTVKNLGSIAFENCSALISVDFYGAPPTADSLVFYESGLKAVYYLPNTSGWGPTFAGLPTAVWQPKILTSPTQVPFGIQANQFDFTVSWASNLSVSIQSCTNLLNSSWSPIATNVLTNGIWQFSDPASTAYGAKFYRVRSQ